MSAFVLYYNPACSKSRAARDLLTAHAADVVVRDYLRQPPDRDELTALLAALGLPARDLIRFSDALAVELGLSPTAAREESEWIALLLSHPQLMQRPLLRRGARAVIARPPERVLELL